MLDLSFSSVLPKLLLGLVILAGCRNVSDSQQRQVPLAPLRLQCRLTGNDPASLRFELHNPGKLPVHALKWNTPLEDPWLGTVIRIVRDGIDLPYNGPMVKRGDPPREDYVTIAAGGTVSADVDLTQVYDLSIPGNYEIQTYGSLADATTEKAELPRPRDRHQALPLRCPYLRLIVR